MNSLIVRKKTILGGKPIIDGTRIGVDDIARFLAHGYGLNDIRRAFPHLTASQLKAALAYLNDTATRQIHSLEKTAV